MQSEQGRPATMNNETHPVPVELTDRWMYDHSIDLFELAAMLWEGRSGRLSLGVLPRWLPRVAGDPVAVAR